MATIWSRLSPLRLVMPEYAPLVRGNGRFLPRRLVDRQAAINHLGTVNVLRPGSNKYSVTDLSGKPCELQAFYEIITGTAQDRPETKAMRRGTEYHRVLETGVNVAQETNIRDLQPQSPEDEWAIKLVETRERIRQLLEGDSGRVREVYVLGMLRDEVVTGYIDLVELAHENEQYRDRNVFLLRGKSQAVDTGSEPSFPRHTSVRLVDTKTRERTTLPPEEQQIRAYHQVLLYHELWTQLSRGLTPWDQLWARLGVDPEAGLGEALNMYLGGGRFTLGDLANSLNHDMSQFQDHPVELAVDYVAARGRGPSRELYTLQRSEYAYDEEITNQLLDRSLTFWQGRRDPVGVTPEQIGRCTWCQQKEVCEWTHKLNGA